MAQLLTTTIDDTGNLTLPAGTTAQRPASPVTAMMRYNTSLNQTEYYDGTAWRNITDTGVEATGGTIIDTEIGGVLYRIHKFTATGNSTFTVTKGGEIEYLIVAGGGAGGCGNSNEGGGGGGAGGLLTGTVSVTPQAYTVTVGAGSAGTTDTGTNSPNGSNSVAFGLTAIGGGSGGCCSAASGSSGGSGGGGGGCGGARPGGSGTAGQGNAGGQGQWIVGAYPENGVNGNGGGGGGAGSPGISGAFRDPFNGTTLGSIGGEGQGLRLNITGDFLPYATGGSGGRGRASHFGSNGQPNTGEGGGGSAVLLSGAGGSGVVIVRYRRNVSTATSPNQTIRSSLPNSTVTDFTIPDGLVLNFDVSKPESYSGTGTVIRNLANTSNNGTLNNSPTFEKAAPDNGRLVFNGSNTFISTSNFLLGNGDVAWTLSAWVNTATAADGLGAGAIASNASGGPVYSSIGVNAGRISYWTYEGAWNRRIGNIVVNDSRWHLLTWVNYTNSTMAMYVDGRVDVDNQRSVSGNNNPIDRFGGSWTAIFDGRISSITINLNRSLTTSEILQTFNATRWRFGV
jgi:hypothetical protein